ncbi:MAG: beta-ketoacyl-[acyl-carrier-protein] synthase II [Armatimonadetes bacterium]|nr:MAG: beta-ketoacyl-[acyl-carrier-protein] synthase II [Armatimonadota bacterium]
MARSPGPLANGDVVVTGLGVVSPAGNTVDEFWQGLTSGKSCVGPITHLDATDYTCRIAAEVRDFDPEAYMDRKDARRLSRFLQFATAAAKMAIEDAGLDLEQEDRERIGVLVGSGIGGLDILGEQYERQLNMGPSKVSPFLVPFMIPDMASGWISIQYGLKGPNSCVVTACSTGANAIGDAAHLIARGEADVMICGGTEAPITPIGVAGFCAARALSTRNDDPEHASRPFDKDRDGFVMGEGAGVIVLESRQHAEKRGATVLAEIIGYAQTADAFHITQPDPEADGATRSMRLAVENAGLQPEDVEYVNAHGTSTPYNDRLETAAIHRAFGEHAKSLMVSSIKSMIGHTLGAAGALESIATILALKNGVVPPTINYETPDPDCDLDYVPNEARQADLRIAIKNSFGFGGHNVTLVYKRHDG